MTEWKICKLGDVLELLYGKGLKQEFEKKVQFLFTAQMELSVIIINI